MREKTLPPDTANEIGVLKRREIEARIVGPLLEALGRKFGREAVLEVVRDVIVEIAREQGKQLANAAGGCTLSHLAQAMAAFTEDGALELEVIEQNQERFAFNVTRCRYAELYRELGIPELGFMLSCNRDFALMEGFNPKAKLERTQTVMEGAFHCDFRFTADATVVSSKKKE